MKVKIKEFKISERKSYIAKMMQYIGRIGEMVEDTIYYNFKDPETIIRVDFEDGAKFWFNSEDIEEIEEENNEMELKIKYIDKNMTKLTKMDGGDLIDLRVSRVIKNGEEVSFPCEYKFGDTLFFKLGFAMKMPKGKKANVYPRSGMFKNYGFLLTNSVGQIDNSYCGSDNEWMAMVWCTRNGIINYNDRILQFEVVNAVMDNVKFTEVEELEDKNRGSYGSTGVK